MDFRFFAAIAVIALIMDILGKLARKRAGPRAPGADPSVQGWEELEWLPGAHDAVPEPAAPQAEHPAPELFPAAQTEMEPAGLRADRIVEYRDRTSRPVEGRSRDRRSLGRGRPGQTSGTGERESSPAAKRPVPATPEATLRTGAGTVGDRLGLRTIGTLRQAVVAREVLGPPLALREDDPRF